ncbi:YdcF family protein [Fructobacillus cardui]|uniref:YdcF family protein n=1 Tax=Fructobacillus cardui TaxID=2893170 RepID=UPI00200ABAD5|nr:YdcF family protein [Fructobacillus cardui]MCK8627462.1 YdcF family protein [Fructobacillus cardui]
MQGVYSITIILLVTSVLATGGSWYLIQKNRYRLLCGIALNVTLITYILTVVAVVVQVNRGWLRTIFVVGAFLVLIPIFLLVLSSSYLFLWNAYLVWRRESHSFGNTLTLWLGVLLLVVPAFFRLLNRFWAENYWVMVVEKLANSFQLYLLFWVLSFLSSYLLTKIIRYRYDREYIIVLGAGLLHGDQVSPLLASRIQVAADFRQRQLNKTQKPLKLIMSGGQGGDEKLPEAVAMKAYAEKIGIPADAILVEDQSKNTYQNMAFSKKIVLKHGWSLKQGLFATNDYHVFRAAGFARFVGLEIDGLGAKTSRYFLPNALIREYVAILLQHKVFHAILALVLVVNSFFV